jgi:hypothetical protein
MRYALHFILNTLLNNFRTDFKRQISLSRPTAKIILNNFRQMEIMFPREDLPSFPETTKYVEIMPFWQNFLPHYEAMWKYVCSWHTLLPVLLFGLSGFRCCTAFLWSSAQAAPQQHHINAQCLQINRTHTRQDKRKHFSSTQ